MTSIDKMITLEMFKLAALLVATSAHIIVLKRREKKRQLEPSIKFNNSC